MRDRSNFDSRLLQQAVLSPGSDNPPCAIGWFRAVTRQLAPDPYRVALQQAAVELKEITAQFNQLRSKEVQLETLVGAFRPSSIPARNSPDHWEGACNSDVNHQ